jgi:hypothetical protein
MTLFGGSFFVPAKQFTAKKVVVLKGLDFFSRPATGANLNMRLATEEIFPRRSRLFQHPLTAILGFGHDLRRFPGPHRIYSISCPETPRNTHAKVEDTLGRSQALP